MAFVAVINYLLSAMQWVEHTDRVIGNANETVKLSIDMETGMRGFLITGDERFLDPYEVAKPRIFTSLKALRAMVQDNPQQTERIDRLVALQQAWNDFSSQMIASRRNQGDYQTSIGNGRGKRLTDEIRKEFDDFIVTEQQLRMARNEKVNSVTVWAITAFVLFIVTLSALLAYLGRRDLLLLSNSYVDNFAGPAPRHRAPGAPGMAAQRPDPARRTGPGPTDPGDARRQYPALFASYLGSVVGPSMYAMNKGNWCVWPATA